MKEIIFILLIMVLYKPINIYAQTPANDPNWDTDTLTLNEQFKYSNLAQFMATGNGKTLDIHSYFSGMTGCQSNFNISVNHHDSIYCSQDGSNITWNGAGRGVATLVTKKGGYTDVSCGKTYKYTTGCFGRTNSDSGNGFHGGQKYGYWEINMRVPQYTGAASYSDNTAGFGGDFWLTGTGAPLAPYYSEIDMYEMSSWDNAWTGTLHYRIAGTNPMTGKNYLDINAYDTGFYIYRTGNYALGGWPTPLYQIDSSQGYFYPPVNYKQTAVNDSGWHKFGMDWEPNYVKWYIDDTLAKFAYYDYAKFNDSMYMIIGMNFLGELNKSKNQIYVLSDTSNFPYNYEIDYVKRYKLKTDCSSAYSACSFNPSSYPWGVKKSIEITGSSCTTDITSGQNVTLRATDHVTLDKNFKVEKGATFQIIMQPCPN